MIKVIWFILHQLLSVRSILCQNSARQACTTVLRENWGYLFRSLLDLQTSVVFPSVMPSIVQLLSDVEFIKGNKQVIFAVCLTPHYNYLGLHQYEPVQFGRNVPKIRDTSIFKAGESLYVTKKLQGAMCHETVTPIRITLESPSLQSEVNGGK